MLSHGSRVLLLGRSWLYTLVLQSVAINGKITYTNQLNIRFVWQVSSGI